MPIIIPSGLLRGERISKLSDEARLYWPFFYAGSNGYGRVKFDYSWILSHCFHQFHSKPSKELVVKLLQEYRSAHLLYAYRSGNEIWGAWDSAAKQKLYSREDQMSPPPPEPAFSEWLASYQSSKHPSEGLEADFPEVKELDQEKCVHIQEMSKISRACTSTTTSITSSSSSSSINIKEQNSSESNVVPIRRPVGREQRAEQEVVLPMAANGGIPPPILNPPASKGLETKQKHGNATEPVAPQLGAHCEFDLWVDAVWCVYPRRKDKNAARNEMWPLYLDKPRRALFDKHLSLWIDCYDWKKEGRKWVPNLAKFVKNQEFIAPPNDYIPPRSEFSYEVPEL